MNALATDQAKRIAKSIWNNEKLKDHVTAGLFIGGDEDAPTKSMPAESQFWPLTLKRTGARRRSRGTAKQPFSQTTACAARIGSHPRSSSSAPNGPLMFMPESLEDSAAKNDFLSGRVVTTRNQLLHRPATVALSAQHIQQHPVRDLEARGESFRWCFDQACKRVLVPVDKLPFRRRRFTVFLPLRADFSASFRFSITYSGACTTTPATIIKALR